MTWRSVVVSQFVVYAGDAAICCCFAACFCMQAMTLYHDENEDCESRRDYMFIENANDKGFDPGWGRRLVLAYGLL